MIVKKIKKYIKDGEYEIKYISNFRRFQGIPVKGFIEPDNDTILINNNLSGSEKITTIIHEFLHEIYPTWSESQVEKKCLSIYKNLSKNDREFFEQLL